MLMELIGYLGVSWEDFVSMVQDGLGFQSASPKFALSPSVRKVFIFKPRFKGKYTIDQIGLLDVVPNSKPQVPYT